MTGPRRARDARADLVELVRRGVAWPDLRPAPGSRAAAVLVLLGALDDVPAHHRGTAAPADLDVLLVGRSPELRSHPGQVAFPGGRVDPGDASVEAAALREAVEETGVDPSGVEVLGTLGSLPVHASRHVVTPVLGWWHRPSPVRVVDSRESAAVFRAPVADLVDPGRRGTVAVRHEGVLHRTPAFEVDGGHVVWGFTAVVLDRLLTELGWAEPWDRRREVRLPT